MARTAVQLVAAALILFYVYNLISLIAENEKLPETDIEPLKREVARLERLIADGNDDIDKLRSAVTKEWSLYEESLARARGARRYYKLHISSSVGQWQLPIAVLVFVCNRPTALSKHISKLIKYHQSAEKFPIIISQDCDDSRVAKVAQSFGSAVQYIKHLSGDKANITVAAGHERYVTYYRIARHYKLGLSYIFDELKYSTVIITEDDLDIAPDFFSYFDATRYLLQADPSLYCVSAWNDNGKVNLIDGNATEVLYRSDFFPGLGWMMTRELWNELKPIWPSGFWDDWIRDPLRRRNRTCIRPEISRTGMTSEGQKGASKGLFFTKHLAKISVNVKPVDFTKLNLDYLLKDNYDDPFLKRVYSARKLTLSTLGRELINVSKEADFRLEYSTLNDYLQIADRLQIMRDFKAGVPRTAYHGVVTCFINGVRLFVAPDRSVWSHYDPSWEAPDNPADMLLSG